MVRGNEELINEKPNQGVRERKKVGIHWSRQCGIRKISQSYGPSWPVTRITLLRFTFLYIAYNF
jgi:hypothetical protein